MRPLFTKSALLVVVGATAASAQIPNASPANLGLPGNPGFSIGLLALSGSSGLDPISFNDFAPYSGKALPASQRDAWLQMVTAKGGENGRLDAGFTPLAMSVGPLALQISAAVAGNTKLNPDAVEAMLFGNAGRTGTSRDMNL